MVFFWLFVKRNDYHNAHRKFQVHITNIFVLGAKTNIARWQPPPLPLTLAVNPTPTQGRVVKFFALK